MGRSRRDRGLHQNNHDRFYEYTLDKRTVTAVVPENDRVYRVERDRDSLRVYLANIYILTEADVIEIRGRYRGIDCIVNVNAYNSYTPDAKDAARKHSIGLFSFSEFMGAVYRYGDDFLDYVAPDRDE